MDISIMCGDSSVDGVESVVILTNGSEVISFIVLEGVFDVQILELVGLRED